MSNKTVDVDLRLRAKNLTKASLGELVDDVERLEKAQKAQASSSDLAAKSMRELTAQQTQLQQVTKELARRQGVADKYKEERAQVVALSQKLQELTAISREMAKGSGGTLIGFKDADVKSTNKAVEQTRREFEKTVASVGRLEASLASFGVNVREADGGTAALASALARSQEAYAGATASVQRYDGAVAESQATTAQANAIIAEAVQRLDAETAARARVAAEIISNRNRVDELATLRKDIEARSEATRQSDVQAEASRRLRAEIDQETTARLSSINALVAEKNRSAELAALRRDIQARSAAMVGTLQREEAAQAAGNARRDRLIALLQSERGQKVLVAEATRREAAAEDAAAAAKTKNAAAQDRANASGREALSVYQRVRGQVLSLLSAYVGLYGAINTITQAIEATNRGQSLQIGLRTINNGDLKAAGEDYKFLRQEADKLGLVFDDLAPQYANLAISAKALGLSNARVRQIFSDTATTAAAMNLTVEDTEGVFRAMTQIFSKGKVAAEELRGQLGDRLPGAVVQFAKANGIALSDLDKQLQAGSVGVGFVIKGIQQYAANYDSEMANITDRLSAYINRARNSYNDWLRELLNGSNQDKLKKAFGVIEAFFQGQDGKRFAEALGQAFSLAVDVFILLARNIDTVVLALKAFLAIGALSFVNNLWVAVSKLSKAFVGYRVAVLAAAEGTGAMALASKGFLALLGPLGAGIAAVGAIWLSYTKYVNDANKSMDQFVDTLHRARQAQGTTDIGKSLSEVNDQLKTANDELSDAVKARDALTGRTGGASGAVQTFKGVFLGGALTPEEAESDIVTALEKQAALQQEKINLQEKYNRALADEKQKQKDLANEKLPGAIGGKKPKVPKGPDPESVQDRIATLTEDLRKKLAETEIESNAATLEQIQANYEGRLKVIDSEVANAQTRIDALKRAAAASNRGKGVDVTTELTTLQGALDAYKQAAAEQAKLKESSETIALYEKQITDLVNGRAAKIQLINQLQQNGAISSGEAWAQTVRAQDESNAKIREQVATFTAFLGTIDPNSNLAKKLGIDQLFLSLQQVNAEAQKLSTLQIFTKKYASQLGAGLSDTMHALAGGLADAVQGAGSLSDAFKDAATAFRNFAADFLVQIAGMIAQAVILQAIQNATSGSTGGYFNAAIGALTGHTGGVVGNRIGTNKSMSVSPSAFVGAPRFHGGGLPGLAPNEVPAILKKGEEVLNENDPRNALNGGMMPAAGPARVDLTVINTTDPARTIREGITGAMPTVINEFGRHKNAIKQQLGI